MQSVRDKLFNKLRKFRLNIDKELNKKAKHDVSKLITKKKEKKKKKESVLKRSFQKRLANLKNYGNL